MAKLYRRIGIRRDNNFSDIQDPKKALNNLLDKLVDTGGTFISEDLDVIRGLFATGMSAGEYQQFAGSTVRETNIDGTTRAADPAITYQNRLDKFKVNSGESPRLNGGNGLTANYFNQDQVKFTTEPDVFVGVTTGPAIPSDTFWEKGNFVYTRKINQQSINAAGGAQWDGFFVPTQTGSYRFSISSSLGFTGEFEKEGYTTGISTFNSFARIGLSTTLVASGGNTVNANATADNITITGSTANTLSSNIAIGMTVTSCSPSRVVLGSSVTGISTNATQTIITLGNEDTDPVTSSGAVNIELGRPAGKTVSKGITTHTLEKFRPYRVRFRFFLPENVDPAGLDKSITFTYRPPGNTTSSFLRYNNLYSLDYDFSDEVKGTFNTFLDQSVLFGGNKDDGTETIGSTTNSDGYVRVSTNKKVDIKYTPKTALTQIERATVTASWTVGSKVIQISDTTGIEIGNYVFSASQGLTANVNTPVRVTDVIINSFIVIDTPATNTRTAVDLTFVNHRGFVKRVTASSSGGNVSISNADTTPRTSGLRTNQVAIWNGSASYSGITTNGAANNVTVFPAQGFGTQRVYFYESKGLIDRALATFCVPAETQCFLVTSDVASGATVLPTTSTANISVGYTIQGFPFAAGTSVIGKTASSLTLDTATVRNISADSNFTATSSSQDKSLCCPPTDTSPPFEPSESGLETTVAQPNVRLTGGNLIFTDLIATIPSSDIVTITPGAAMPSAKTIDFRGGDGVTYKLLCV
jgi:hypothetical protein